MSPFATSNEICNRTTHHPALPSPPQNRLKQLSIFILTFIELNDLKGPETLICTMMVYGGDVKRLPHDPTPAKVEINNI